MSGDSGDEICCDEVVELVTDSRTRVEMHLVTCGGGEAYVGQEQRTIAACSALSVNGSEPAATGRLIEAFRGWRWRAEEEA